MHWQESTRDPSSTASDRERTPGEVQRVLVPSIFLRVRRPQRGEPPGMAWLVKSSAWTAFYTVHVRRNRIGQLQCSLLSLKTPLLPGGSV